MTPESQALAVLRGELTDILSGSFFVFFGLVSFLIALVRRRGGVRLLVWIGIWSFVFGSHSLVQSAAIQSVAPPWFRPAMTLWAVCASYLTLVAAVLAYLELTIGPMRRLLQVLLFSNIAVAAGGIVGYVLTGRAEILIVPNQILAVIGLVALLFTLAVPNLSKRFLVLSRHRVLTVGTFLFAAQALWTNIARTFDRAVPGIYGSLGFAILLMSFAYVALDMILANERRLLSVNKELQIARELQFAILPAGPPKAAKLRIAAAYEPMTAVAGDFYEFVAIDESRIGFLVADVSGHGVPAALIASMVKVAVQAADGCAGDPGEVLRRVGGLLHNNLRGQFVSAAYLWIDSSERAAVYSAAGHPPLLHWRHASGELQRVESNGLLFGVMPNVQYPACRIPLERGDRFLLYTDGVTESENVDGEQFGDRRLEEVVREGQSFAADDLLRHISSELYSWRPETINQQDDITLIIIDVL